MPTINDGFYPKEISRIRALILQHLEHIVEAWDEHCGDW